MAAADSLDAQVKPLAVLILVAGCPTGLAYLQEASRLERMAQELEYAVRHTRSADMEKFLEYLASDGGAALIRRVTGLWDLAWKVVGCTVNDLDGTLKAYLARRPL